jgi:hypothetical protein
MILLNASYTHARVLVSLSPPGPPANLKLEGKEEGRARGQEKGEGDFLSVKDKDTGGGIRSRL